MKFPLNRLVAFTFVDEIAAVDEIAVNVQFEQITLPVEVFCTDSEPPPAFIVEFVICIDPADVFAMPACAVPPVIIEFETTTEPVFVLDIARAHWLPLIEIRSQIIEPVELEFKAPMVPELGSRIKFDPFINLKEPDPEFAAIDP